MCATNFVRRGGPAIHLCNKYSTDNWLEGGSRQPGHYSVNIECAQDLRYRDFFQLDDGANTIPMLMLWLCLNTIITMTPTDMKMMKSQLSPVIWSVLLLMSSGSCPYRGRLRVLTHVSSCLWLYQANPSLDFRNTGVTEQTFIRKFNWNSIVFPDQLLDSGWSHGRKTITEGCKWVWELFFSLISC